jgi:hypothetical protein
MKKMFKAHGANHFAPLGIIALVAIIGLMAGCNQPTSNGTKGPTVTPVAADFEISGLTVVADGGSKSVSISPKAGKSGGAITVWYEGTSGTSYTKSNTAPSAVGSYTVTFDVAATSAFKAAKGLSAGTLRINAAPVDPEDAHFTISGLQAIETGKPQAVTIKSQTGKSAGAITVWYEGTGETNYAKSITAPSAAGSYTVTFDITAATGFNAKTGLSAGTLVISPLENALIIDFEDNVWGGNSYTDRDVTHEKLLWKVGAVGTMDANDRFDDTRSIRFRGNAEADNHRLELVSYIDGIKSIYFDYASYSSHSGGIVALYSQIQGNANWVKVGDDVTAPAWSGAMLNVGFDLNINQKVRFKIVREGNVANQTSVNIDNVIIVGTSATSFDVNEVPQVSDFTVGELIFDFDGTPKPVSITPKEDKSQGQITKWYTGAGGTNYPRSQTAPSAVGRYAVTFDVAAATGFDAAPGLSAGTLVINEVITGPHIIIDFEDAAWAGGSYTTPKKLTDLGCEWEFIGYTAMDNSDRRDGTRSLRLRGNSGDNCHVELLSYIKGIKSVSFDYGSYGAHTGGTIALYYQIKDSGTWTKAGEDITSPLWTTVDAMLTATVNLNKTESVRFKIVREGNLAGSSTVNIDNIKIIGTGTGETLEIEEPEPEAPVAGDFTITKLTATANGDPKEVSIVPKTGKSQGDITIYYEGTDGTDYEKSEDAPSAVGKYAVTFDVAAAAGFTAVTGLIAGTLVISEESTGGGPGGTDTATLTIDFENGWDGANYTDRTVTHGGYAWRVSGVVSATDSSDRATSGKSIRLRGNSGDNCRVELTDYFENGIKSISFDYASYGAHQNGIIVLSYQIEGSSTWTVATGGTVTAPVWNATTGMLTAKVDLDIEDSVRFKIAREGTLANSTSANVDNIVITYFTAD